MNDHQANVTIHAALELAVKLRDETGPSIATAAQRVIDAAGGDALAAITVIAALVRVDDRLDVWWQNARQEELFHKDMLTSVDEYTRPVDGLRGFHTHTEEVA